MSRSTRTRYALIGLALIAGTFPLVGRLVQVRHQENEMWRAEARRSGFEPERYLEVRAYLEQSDQGRGLTDSQWKAVKEYMSSDSSGTFRQLCTALARAEAKRGRVEAIQELRQRLDDPDPYVVASTLAHLVKWLKVPDSEQLMAKFAKDEREPVRDVVENIKTNPPEDSSFQP